MWVQIKHCRLSVHVCFLALTYRWLKFEEDVEDGGERWSKPYVATLSLHSLFELRSCILNGTVLLDMRASSIEEIAGKFTIEDFYISVLYFLGSIAITMKCIEFITIIIITCLMVYI